MPSKRKSQPLKNPEGRINQLVGLAVDCAEKKLRDGTASSQIIALLLQQATLKTQLELEKLRSDVQVGYAKVDQMKTNEDIKKLYEQALNAMRDYQGYSDDDDLEDDDYV